MAHLARILIGKQARALAAALAIGATVLSLAPGQTAYAARTTSTEPADPDSGAGGTPAGGRAGSGTAARVTLCAWTDSDGHVDFYLPGEVVSTSLGKLKCGTNGKWYQVRTSSTYPSTDAGNSGVHAR